MTEALYRNTHSCPPAAPSGSPVAGLHLRLERAAGLEYESFRILNHVDAAKRFHLALDPSFPLTVKLYDFPEDPAAIPMTWHERLEIFCPLTGPGEFRIGEDLEPFEENDILLINNLRLHGVESFRAPQRRALVVVFYPELIAGPGALPCDMWLLRPFRHLRRGCLRLHSRDACSAAAWECLSRLLMAQLEGGTTRPVRPARNSP